jgi:hypothetical protein
MRFELFKERQNNQKEEIFHGFDVAEVTPVFPVFQAGLSDCMHFSLSLFVSVAHLEFPRTFLYL